MAKPAAADPATEVIAALQREVGRLADGLGQMVDGLASQGELLAALLQAVTAPDPGDGELTASLDRVATGLAEQTLELAAIRRTLGGAPGDGSEEDGC